MPLQDAKRSRELGYGITDTWDDLVGAIQEIAPTTLAGGHRVLLSWLLLDRPFHRRTALLMEKEARLSRDVLASRWSLRLGVQMVVADLLKRLRRQSPDSGGTKDSKEPQDSRSTVLKMAPIRRATRSRPVTLTPPPVAYPTATTSVTSAQLQAMINQGVTAVLAARDTTRNGDDSHTSGTALTWWNSHVRTVTNDVAYAMTWTDLKKKITAKYCSRNEIKKIKAEMWNLKIKGTDAVAYNQHFQELALLCDRMFSEKTDKIESYVGGMPDLIYSSVVASKPKTMQEAIEMATELMDRRINTFAERQTENKRKFEDTSRNNQNQ
ncbi:reverse transcriptase domain-containing protein [Tanacetum coccineum]